MRILPLLLLIAACASTPRLADPLPSWNDGPSKEAILHFVKRVTDETSSDFVPAPERIATFDNDGTLWSEQPYYFQFQFILDRLRQLAPQHPEWKTTQPYQAALEGDLKTLAQSGEEGLLKLVMVTHAGMTASDFTILVRKWLDEARHPRFDRPYDELVYQPMLELLAFLRANGFKTYIVSGGGVDFIRVYANDRYGIPPEQVVGSRIAKRFETRSGVSVIVREPKLDFLDDKAAKPVGIHQIIGRRPIAAFGNSDGDLQMLQWTADGDGPRFCLLVHHTDAKREWAYDRKSHIGRLDQALDEAARRKWTVVDMKRDWKTVYPPRAAR